MADKKTRGGKKKGEALMSKSLTSLDMAQHTQQGGMGNSSSASALLKPPAAPGSTMGGTSASLIVPPTQINGFMQKAQGLYNQGAYSDCLIICEKIYDVDAYRLDNLLLLGAVHFQLRNYSESVFYNQQSIRVDPHFAEAYSNLGNALKELGDLKGATQFYLKVSLTVPSVFVIFVDSSPLLLSLRLSS